MGTIKHNIYKTKKDRQVLIRNAEANDAREIIEINISVINEQMFMLREPEEANYTIESEISNIANHFRNPGSLYIVAEVQMKVIGFLEIQNGGLRRTSHSGLFSMFILKNYREEGIGQLLLQTLISWAEKNPIIEKISLAVFSTNQRAFNLYRKSGFVEEGRCPRDMKLRDGTYIDSVLMYRFVK